MPTLRLEGLLGDDVDLEVLGARRGVRWVGIKFLSFSPLARKLEDNARNKTLLFLKRTETSEF